MAKFRLSCQNEQWPDGSGIYYETEAENLSVHIFGDPDNPRAYMRCVRVCPIDDKTEVIDIPKSQANLLLASGIEYTLVSDEDDLARVDTEIDETEITNFVSRLHSLSPGELDASLDQQPDVSGD